MKSDSGHDGTTKTGNNDIFEIYSQANVEFDKQLKLALQLGSDTADGENE